MLRGACTTTSAWSCDGVLKSWAVPKGPSLDPGDKRMAVAVEDHPFDYASFEGVIPAKEYGAGRVIVWDCGVYSPDEDREYSFRTREEAQRRVRAGIEQGKLSIFLRGEKLKGSFALVRTATAQTVAADQAQGLRSRASRTSPCRTAPSSRASRSMSSRPASRPRGWMRPGWCRVGPSRRCRTRLAPMLAMTGEAARSDPDWLFEPKLDGYRVIAFVEGTTVRLQSRRGIDLTAQFPEIVAGLAAFGADRMILDGEIVALGPRRPAVIQRAAEQGATPGREGYRGRAAPDARGAGVLRPAAFRRYQSALRSLCGTAPLPCAVPVADDARSTHSCRRGRGGAVCGRHRQWLRRRGRQASATASISRGSASPPGARCGRSARRSSSSAAARRARAPASLWARCFSDIGRTAHSSTPVTSGRDWMMPPSHS